MLPDMESALLGYSRGEPSRELASREDEDQGTFCRQEGVEMAGWDGFWVWTILYTWES